MRSYVTHHANSSRNGRVRLPRLAPVGMKVVAAVAPEPQKNRITPFVLASPEGKHIVVQQALQGRLYAPSGELLDAALGYSLENAYIDGTGIFSGAALHPWGSRVPVMVEDAWWRTELLGKDRAIQRIQGGPLVDVLQRPRDPHRSIDDRFSEAAIVITVFDFDLGLQGQPRLGILWQDEHLRGEGMGAIGADGHVVAAMTDGRLAIYAPELKKPAQAGGKGPVAVETKLGYTPYEISIIEPGYAFLEAVGAPPLGEPARLGWLRKAAGAWTTRLHRHDTKGREVWRVEVGLTVRQPPIDGGSGRVYLAGSNGVVAVEDGKIVWEQRGEGLMMATAFEDGSLAVANGFKLEIWSRDGQTLQSFETARREPITTPPAPASDGSIWLATADALYVAR